MEEDTVQAGPVEWDQEHRRADLGPWAGPVSVEWGRACPEAEVAAFPHPLWAAARAASALRWAEAAAAVASAAAASA